MSKPNSSGRIIEITRERDIGDGRVIADDERRTRQPLVENAERVVDPALQERHRARIAGGFGEVAQEAIRPEIAVELLVVEDDPAQRFQPLVFGERMEFACNARRDRSGSRQTG